MSGVSESIVAFGVSAISRTIVVRGSSPRATTSRTSVLRVITPTKSPPSQTSTARTSGRMRASPASCAVAVVSSACGVGTIASRTRCSRSPVTGRSPGRRVRPQRRGCRRSAQPCAARCRRSRRASTRGRRRRSSFSASRWRISSRSQNSRLRSCTHSKYETVTPPALVRTSGSTGIPRAARIPSPATDVGPLAPSATSRQRSAPAFVSVTWSSRAASTSTSHSSSSSSSFESRLAGIVLERAVLARVLVQCRDVEALPGRRRRPRCRRSRSPPRLARAARLRPPRRRCRIPGPRSAGPRGSSRAAGRRRSITITTPPRSPRSGTASRRWRSACRSRSRAPRGPSGRSRCPSSRPSSARWWRCRAPGCRCRGR